MRWFELFAGPLHLGSRHLVIVSHSNITSRRLQQDEVAASRMNASELAALVASSTDAIMSYDLDGRILTWNRAASDLYGYTPDEAIGQSMEIIYPDDWPVRITEYRDRIISGEMTRFEVVRKTKSGAMRDIAISASPVRDDSGAVVAISNFHRDVTEQKATEERLRFITHELRHRTKNMLAIIGAIERQTARRNETIEGFHKDFSSRLDALAAANDLLVSKAWRPVSLEELCRSQMNLFSDRHADRVRIGGPPVAMDANAVEAIGLSLHELATNALKYGALAGHGGSVDLVWEFVGPDDERRLRFVWHERCGAITPGPHKNGFGHAVVTGVAAQKLGAEVSHEFGDGELVWSAMIPSERVTVEA
jgi:PAS domain S-box-containing protein